MRKLIFLTVLACILIGLDTHASDAYTSDTSKSELPAVTVNIPVDYIIYGDEYTGDTRFTFVLEAEEPSYPMPAGSVGGVKRVQTQGPGRIDFGDITYDYPSEYHYRLYRIPDSSSEVTEDDSSYRIVIAVLADGSSQVAAWKNGEEGKTDVIVFEDRYEKPTVPVTPSPKTGDPSHTAASLVTMGLSGLALLIIAACRRRKSADHRKAQRHRRSGASAPVIALLVTVSLAAGAFLVSVEAADSIIETEDDTYEDVNNDEMILPEDETVFVPEEDMEYDATEENTETPGSPQEDETASDEVTSEENEDKEDQEQEDINDQQEDQQPEEQDTEMIEENEMPDGGNAENTEDTEEPGSVQEKASEEKDEIDENENDQRNENEITPAEEPSEDDEGEEGSLYYAEEDLKPQILFRSAKKASEETYKIVSSYSDGKGRRFKIEGMDGYGLCSWDSKDPAPDGTYGTISEIMPTSSDRRKVIKAMYYGMHKNKAGTPLNKMRLHRLICVWLHGEESLRGPALKELDSAKTYWKTYYADLDDPPKSVGFHVYEWTPIGSHSSNQTIVCYRTIPPLRTPEYKSVKKPDRRSIRYGSDTAITYTIETEEIYTDADTGSFQIKDDLANGLLHLDTSSIKVNVSRGSYKIDKKNDTGLWVTFTSEKASGGKPKITIEYKATVKWENYTGGYIRNALADYTPPPVKVTSDICLKKKVKGTLRDTSKKFEFTVELRGLDEERTYSVKTSGGGELVRASTGSLTSGGFKSDKNGKAVLLFKLKGSQGAEIKNIPIGSKYKITEAESDHRASFILEGDGPSPEYKKESAKNSKNHTTLATALETLDAADGIVTATFTNTRNTAPTSGIVVRQDWRPAAGTSALSLGVVLGMIIRKRRQRYE